MGLNAQVKRRGSEAAVPGVSELEAALLSGCSRGGDPTRPCGYLRVVGSSVQRLGSDCCEKNREVEGEREREDGRLRGVLHGTFFPGDGIVGD